MQIKQAEFKTCSERTDWTRYTISHILGSEMMVHYFASHADKYGGISHHLVQHRAIATAVSDTARFGTTFSRADKPMKADGNARMLGCENQLNN